MKPTSYNKSMNFELSKKGNFSKQLKLEAINPQNKQKKKKIKLFKFSKNKIQITKPSNIKNTNVITRCFKRYTFINAMNNLIK